MTDKELIEKGYRFGRGMYAGLAISPNGDLYSLSSDVHMTPCLGNYAFHQTTYKGKTIYFHRAVASVFVKKPKELENYKDSSLKVIFKDGDKKNLHYTNLDWSLKGTTYPNRSGKLSDSDVYNIKKDLYYSDMSRVEVADKYAISLTTMNNVINGVGCYAYLAHVTGCPIQIGDEVAVSDPSLVSFGSIGTVVSQQKNGKLAIKCKKRSTPLSLGYTKLTRVKIK